MNLYELGQELSEVYAELSTLKMKMSESLRDLRKLEEELEKFYRVKFLQAVEKKDSATVAKTRALEQKTNHPKYEDYLKLKVELEITEKELKVLENQIKVLSSLQYLQTVEAKYS